MPVQIVQHPLVKHKLGLMRTHDISTKDFRDLASEVGSLLTYEATKDLPTEKKTVQGWAGDVEVETPQDLDLAVATAQVADLEEVLSTHDAGAPR